MTRHLRAHLLLVPLALLLGHAAAADPPAPKAPEVERLVAQLSSVRYEEREAASKALEKLGRPALDALRKAARSKDAETRKRAGRLVRQIENGLDALLAAYREYGLPLPPRDARLVRVESRRVVVPPDDKLVTKYALGFLLPSASAQDRHRVLVGTEVLETGPDWLKVEAGRPDDADLKDIDPTRGHGPYFAVNAGLATAVQCHARGWHRLAQRLLDLSVVRGPPLPRDDDDDRPPELEPARTALARLAWAHWLKEIVRPGTNLGMIARRMRALLADEPALDVEGYRDLLRSLEEALRPRWSRPGSVEALIDSLVDFTQGDWGPPPESTYWLLVERGFEAVPALIAHLDDDRLTRALPDGIGAPPWHLHVRDVVSGLLQRLAGEEGRDWPRRESSYTVERAAAQAWWERARREGEEAYLLARFLLPRAKVHYPDELLLRDHLLRALARKYPRRLPGLYRIVLEERPRMESGPLAEAIGKADLPRGEKVALFLRASRHKNLEHRWAALVELRGLDEKVFVERLVETLETLPAKPRVAYWCCREATFAHLAVRTADPRAWRALGRAARRADVGLRMQMLDGVAQGGTGPQRKEALAFLAAFLGDSTVRDIDSDFYRYWGIPAGHGYPRLEVRNFAALELARLLKLPDRPKPEWKPDQWAALRAKVRKALTR